MSIIVSPPVTLTPGTHRFFDDLVTALASQAALTAGYFTHAGYIGYRFLDDWPRRLSCITRREGNSTLEIDVKPASMLTPLTKFAWPTSLDLSWGGLSYSDEDNGRQVMYNDMSQGDVILLMLEMDGQF